MILVENHEILIVGFYTVAFYHLYLKGFGMVWYGMFAVPTFISNV